MKASAGPGRSCLIDASSPNQATDAPRVDIGLVIPCYRESGRLPGFLPRLCDALAEGPVPLAEVLVVDDGSGPAEADALDGFIESVRARCGFVRPLLRLPRNVGKGATVLAGWDELAGRCRLLAFTDADGAVPAPEVARVLRLASGLRGTVAVFGSRTDRHRVERKVYRRIASLLFRGLVHGLFPLPVRDTQCGLKVVPADAYRAIRPALRETGFLFDVELALNLVRHGCPVREEPVEWHEKEGSHLRASHGLGMFVALIGMRARTPVRRGPD